MKNSDPLISVIVPIYGVELYLDQCVESIVNQTYDNLEIILVDDGSQDRCPEIVDSWAKKDERIVAFHKENGGQSSARNLGLNVAKGEYISFVDGDDWLEKDAIDNLFIGLKTFDADISVGAVRQIRNNDYLYSKFVITNKFKYIHCKGMDALKFFLEENIAVMAKLYKKSVLEGIFFPEGRKSEEYVFLLNIIDKVESTVFYNGDVYDYVIRDNSDSHDIKPGYLIDCIQSFVEVYTICDEKYPQYVDFCRRRLTELTFELLSCKRFGVNERRKRADIINKAIAIVGEYKTLNVLPEVIVYTYMQFYKYLSSKEKRYLQKIFRRKWIELQKYHKLRYSLGFFSLRVNMILVYLYREIRR